MECKNCKKCSLVCKMYNNSDNPFPYLTPSLCGHTCKDDCIFGCDFKEQELDFSEEAFKELTTYPEKIVSKDIFIVGLGITGLTIAHILLKNGLEPMLFDTSSNCGGLLANCIPSKRIKNLSYFKKHASAIKSCCTFAKSDEIIPEVEQELLVYCRGYSNYRHQYNSKELNIIAGPTFLQENYNKQLTFPRGAKIAIIGLGNTACDVAEKCKGYDTTIFYRRTVAESRAHKERLDAIKDYTTVVENSIPTEEELKNYYIVIECLGTEPIKLATTAITYEHYVKLADNIYVGGEEAFGSSTVENCILSGIEIAKDIIQKINNRE